MLLSEHIERLQTLLVEKGDQELFMWVDSGEDTLFLVSVPEFDVAELDGDEYQIPKEFRNSNGNALTIVNLTQDLFDEETDGIQDLEL